VATVCLQLIWGHNSARKGQGNIGDWKSDDLGMESLNLLPREYPTGFSELLHSLIGTSSEKDVTLEDTLLKLQSLEDTLERSNGVATVCGADIGKLTAMLAMAMKNQIGSLRQRERQLVEERDVAIKSLEQETSKQEVLVEEIELLAREKRALAREQDAMAKKLKKLTHRRNVYAKKYRLAAAGKLVDQNCFSTEEQCWKHSRNIEKCEALLQRHELALQELQRLADEDEDCDCGDRSGVDSEGSGDSALPASDDANFYNQTDSDHDPGTSASFCNDGNDSTRHLKSLEPGGFQVFQSYRQFKEKVQSRQPPETHLIQDADPDSSIGVHHTKPIYDAKPGERLVVMTPEMERVIPQGGTCGLWKRRVAGQVAVIAHKLDSKQLQELFTELSSASCTIQLLEVGWTDLVEDGCVYLAEALKKNTTVEELNLHHCGINAEGAAVLSAALDCCQSVKVVRLNWNNIGSMGVTHLVPLLKRNCAVTSFELSWNDIDYQGAESLAVALAGNCSLTSLDLSNNYIGPQGACRLAEALIRNDNLSKLCLKGNGIGGKGGRAIFRAVKEKRSLKHLDLSDNDLGDETVSVFANVLLENKSGLTAIDLSGNDIRSPGACQIALGLKNNKTLSHLNLSENNIDDSGGIELASVLMGGCHLCCIGVHGNQLSREIIGFLKDVEKQEYAA
jgi:Ran GTPase-activating protein (RanGAP) involved in mRNA processing and transport